MRIRLPLLLCLLLLTCYTHNTFGQSGSGANGILYVPSLACDAATMQINTVNGNCIGCFVSNGAAAVDTDASTASVFNMPVVLFSASIQQSLIFPSIGEQGDTVAVAMKVPASLQASGVLVAIQISSSLGTTSNNDLTSLSSTANNLKVITSGNSLLVKYVPPNSFDRVTIVLNSGLVAAFNSLQVYYASRMVAVPKVMTDTIRTFNGEEVTLKATSSRNVVVTWYTTAHGGNPLPAGTEAGTALVRPPHNATTIYYAQATRILNNCINPDRVPVTVITSAPNQPPVIIASDGNTVYTPGNVVAIDPGIVVTDPDDSTLSSALVSIISGFEPAQDQLIFTNDGLHMGDISSVYDAATGILTLTAPGRSATLDQWQQALRAVAYVNQAAGQLTGKRTISFKVKDNTDFSLAAIKQLIQQDLLAQSISVADVNEVYGNQDVELNASVSSGLPLRYESNDNNIALAYQDSLDGRWKMKLKKAGQVSVKVSQSGNNVYAPAADAFFNFTILPAALTVIAKDAQKTYDKVPYTGGNGIMFTGFVLGETEDILDGTPVYSGTAQTASDAGAYTIIPSGLSSPNYSITFVTGTLTISKAALTITAGAKYKVYGDADPALTYTTEGLLSGDQLTGVLNRIPGEHVNTYSINQNTLTAGTNYTVNYNGAFLTVTKSPLTIVAQHQQLCEGSSLPAFGLSYSGFKNGENENVLTIKPTVSTSASGSSPAGTYTLIPGGGTASNYSFNYINGLLQINPLPIVQISSNGGDNISKGITLLLTANGGSVYRWLNANGILSGQNSAALTVRPDRSETYTVMVTNSTGCTTIAAYKVIVRDDFEAIAANNVITPNGDGINDLWVVQNIDMYPNNEVKIFDKAGRLIYRKKGYDNTWNGTWNGVALAENTYYYILDFGTGKPQQKGYITVIRDN